MIKQENDGKYVLSFETNAVIRRIPLAKYGTSRNGMEWSLGSMLVEAFDEDESQSAQLFLITWDSLMIEQIERLGVGKKVHIKYHVSVREKFDSYDVSLIIDEIDMLSDGENFLVGKKKVENK